MTKTWSFCLIFTLNVASCSAITVSDGQDVWAVNISGLEFEYSLDCSNPAITCAYTWKHNGSSTAVQLFADADCTSTADYSVQCEFNTSTSILTSKFTIEKQLSVNNTEVVVEGPALSGVTPIVIRLDYCDINDLENPNGVSLSPDLCDYNCVSTFSCNEGFVGNSADLTCLRNATWSSTNLICEPVSCSGSSCNNCCEGNSQNQLSNIKALSYNESVTAQCCDGFSDPNVETANFTCTKSGPIDPNLNCMPVMCSLDLCANCCYSGQAVSAGITLSYNQLVTVECCVGFTEITGPTSMNYTCLSNQSFDANLTCVEVRCSVETINEACQIGCVHSNVSELTFGENITLECDTNYVSNITIASCIGFNRLDSTLNCTPDIVTSTRPMTVENLVSIADPSTMTTIPVNTNTPSNTTKLQTVENTSYVPWSTDKSFQTHSTATTDKSFQTHSTATIPTTYPNNVTTEQSTMISLDSVVPNATLRAGTIAGIVEVVAYTPPTVGAGYFLWVASNNNINLGPLILPVVASFVMFIISLGLLFGLPGDTSGFTTGGIVGLVIGIIAIIGMIISCVWIWKKISQSKSKIKGSTSTNDGGKPGNNSVPGEEDVNMMPGNENL